MSTQHIVHKIMTPGQAGDGFTVPEASAVRNDIDRLKTKSYDVRDLVPDTTGTTVMTSQMQAAVNALPSGAALHIPATATINLDDTITITNAINLYGEGELRWTAGMEVKSGLQVNAAYTTIQGVRLTNAMGSSGTDRPSTGASSRAVNISADYVTVAHTRIHQWETGIVQNASGEFYGLIVTGNKITDCWGVGSEAKGDGIMAVGAGAVITNNLVAAKEGTDARCGIVIEGLPEYKVSNQTSNATNIDEAAFVVTGNIVRGPFRRSIHAETVYNYTISDNICIGARWWGMMIWGGDMGVVANNHIRWTENGTPGTAATIPAPMYVQLARRVRITGNVIRIETGSVWNHAMYLADSTGSGVPAAYTIESNTLLNNSGGTGNGINGINLDAETITIRNNIFRGQFGKGIYLYSSLTGQLKSADAVIEGNDMRLGPSATHIHTFGYRRTFAERNYMATASSTLGIFIENGVFGLAAHNKFAGMATGINGTGTTAAHAPNNSFIVVGTPTTAVTNTTTYG